MAIKGVSDEQIIAAIISNGTIAAAAEACGISSRTIYDRMKEANFRSAYMQAQNDILRQAVYNLNKQMAAAVTTIADIMNDSENNPAVRLQAAQTILNNAGKFADRLSITETAARNENRTAADILADIMF